jgi:hypothetical protein
MIKKFILLRPLFYLRKYKEKIYRRINERLIS